MAAKVATVEAVMATARRADHLPGCPVATGGDDPELAARVETYRAERIDRQGRTVATAVAHCCECGAMTYSEER